MNVNKHSIAYVRFLSLIENLRSSPGFPNIDNNERILLEHLAGRWYQGRKTRVLEMMNDSECGMSPSSVHRRLKALKQKGLLRLEEDPMDNRNKFIMPTDRTMEYFESLGDCMLQSSQVS